MFIFSSDISSDSILIVIISNDGDKSEASGKVTWIPILWPSKRLRIGVLQDDAPRHRRARREGKASIGQMDPTSEMTHFCRFGRFQIDVMLCGLCSFKIWIDMAKKRVM